MLLQRLESRLPMKGSPAGFDETLECACALGPLPKMMLVEMAMQRSQHIELDLRHCRVIDPLAGAQRQQPLLERSRLDLLLRFMTFAVIHHGGHVDVQHVQEHPARWAIRTAVPRVVRKQSVQRIDADNAGAVATAGPDDSGQIAEVADPPVAGRAQTVELERQTPGAVTIAHRFRPIAGGGRHREPAVRDPAAVSQNFDAVIAERRHFAELQTQLVEAVSVEFDRGKRCHRVWRQRQLRAVLGGDTKFQASAFIRSHTHRQLQRTAVAHDRQRRQGP